MTEEELRDYEKKMHEQTNEKVLAGAVISEESNAESNIDQALQEKLTLEDGAAGTSNSESTPPKDETTPEATAAYGNPVTAVASGIKSWLSWS